MGGNLLKALNKGFATLWREARKESGNAVGIGKDLINIKLSSEKNSKRSPEALDIECLLSGISTKVKSMSRPTLGSMWE